MKSKTKKVAGIVGGVAVAALGAFFYAKTPKGKKQVAKISAKASAWAVNAKKDILNRVKDLKEVNEKTYHTVVDAVMKKYETVKKIAPKEVAMVGNELKKHWAAAKKEIGAQIKKDIVGKVAKK